MKVIFLDIDGVLITSNIPSPDLDGNEASYNGLDESAVENLNRLIDKTDARIVISSSLRMSNSVSQLISILKNGGVKDPPVIDVTPFVPDRRTNRSHRGKEISLWLAQHSQVESYIVIDDCDARQLEGIPECRIVNTVYRDGFGDTKAYQKAVEMLEEVSVV